MPSQQKNRSTKLHARRSSAPSKPSPSSTRRSGRKKATDHWTAKEHLAHMAVTQEVETLVETRQALAGEPDEVPGIESRAGVLPFRQQGMESPAMSPSPNCSTA